MIAPTPPEWDPPPPAPSRQAGAPLECNVQARIADALRRIGCDVFVHHVSPRGARHSVTGFGRGFVDLMVLDCGRVLFAEVKRSERERPRADQLAMHQRLRRAGQCVFVWWNVQQAIEDIMQLRGMGR